MRAAAATLLALSLAAPRVLAGIVGDANFKDMQLAQAVRGFAGRHHALLLANHGPVVAGTSLAAAADAVEELEATAGLYLLLQGRQLRTLTPEQVADIRRRYPAG